MCGCAQCDHPAAGHRSASTTDTTQTRPARKHPDIYTAASCPRPKADALPAGGCILGVFWVYFGQGGGSTRGAGRLRAAAPGGQGQAPGCGAARGRGCVRPQHPLQASLRRAPAQPPRAGWGLTNVVVFTSSLRLPHWAGPVAIAAVLSRVSRFRVCYWPKPGFSTQKQPLLCLKLIPYTVATSCF